MTRFAVLGANSFSGRAFVEHARVEGDEVLCLQRPDHDVDTDHGLDLILHEVRRAQVTHFVNFAALNVVEDSWERFAEYFRTNLIGISQLAYGLRLWGGLEKFVQVSTPEVYGSTGVEIDESAPYAPSTPYAVSRAAIDMQLRAMFQAYGFPVCFTRTVNVYGPGQQPYRIIPKTVLSILRGEKLKLHGGGVSTRSFIHICDAARAYRLVALWGQAGEVYHVSTRRQTEIRELVRMVCALMGAKFDEVVEMDAERLGKDLAYRLDGSKIRAELDWSDTVDLEAGLAETVRWFVDNRDRYIERARLGS